MQSLDASALPPIWPPLRDLLREFGRIQDRLDPARLPEFIEALSPLERALHQAQSAAPGEGQGASADVGQSRVVSILNRAASQALTGAARFAAARSGPHEILKAFQSLRPVARAEEILYPLAAHSDEVSRFFLPPTHADDEALLAALRSPGGGLSDHNHERGRRGGYSLYVPEYYVESKAWPLIVALHGGSGHGADFLWSWLRDARARGCLLAAPSSLGRTWSLHRPGVDAAALNEMLDQISGKYHIDAEHILLTGISDGGTYAMLLSTAKQTPFTHFAPVAAAVHVLVNAAGAAAAPVASLKIYQVHGALDWMFAVDRARHAAQVLQSAGAALVYREIEDLSHNYPRDANAGILDWFLG